MLIMCYTPQERQFDNKVPKLQKQLAITSHPSKVMLKIILNRLKPQAEEILDRNQNRQVFQSRKKYR